MLLATAPEYEGKGGLYFVDCQPASPDVVSPLSFASRDVAGHASDDDQRPGSGGQASVGSVAAADRSFL